MLRFLFWNLNRKPISPLVAKIAELHDVDVVLLAEMTGDPGLLASELTKRSRSRPYHHAKPNLCDKVHFFARFSPALIPPVYDTRRMTIRQLVLPGRETILMRKVPDASNSLTIWRSRKTRSGIPGRSSRATST